MTKTSRWFSKNIFAWSLFDFANSSYAVIIVAFVYAIYFKKVVAGNLPIADFYWSSSINITMLIVAVLSPVLGAAADYRKNKKTYLLFFTMLSVLATALLYFVRENMLIEGMALFIISNIGFQAGLGFYDAFLKEITSEKNYNKVSSLGYAVGYLGSLFSLGAVLIFQDEPRLTFVSCALIYLVFSIPLFKIIKEDKPEFIETDKINFILLGFRRTRETIRHIGQYKELRLFLFAYFLFIDGVNTIIFFSAIYAQTTLNFTIPELILFFVIVQVTALLGSFLFGWLADKFGTKRILLFNLLSWSVLTLLVFFNEGKTTYFIIGALAGMFLGSTQALSRSMMSKLTPEEKKTEFFGFYSLFEKTSTILGPLCFGLVSWLSGSQRYAVISIIIFFISGYFLLRKVSFAEVK